MTRFVAKHEASYGRNQAQKDGQEWDSFPWLGRTFGYAVRCLQLDSILSLALLTFTEEMHGEVNIVAESMKQTLGIQMKDLWYEEVVKSKVPQELVGQQNESQEEEEFLSAGEKGPPLGVFRRKQSSGLEIRSLSWNGKRRSHLLSIQLMTH